MNAAPSPPDPLRDRLRSLTLAPEAERVGELIRMAALDAPSRHRIAADAADLVRAVRGGTEPSLMESFLAEYGLSTAEGVGLMCLAEALLRVPDAQTIDELIRDKIEPSDWGAHLGRSSSSLVNASTWALMLTGRLLDDDAAAGPVAALRGLVRRLGEPVVRVAVAQAMKALGQQFVLGETIGEALRHSDNAGTASTFSYDMLGEAARTAADAARYHRSYARAIRALAKHCTPDIRRNAGISIKLSALHPRYEFAQRDRVLAELVPRVVDLARIAAQGPIGLNVDAEEAERLDLSLDVIGEALSHPALADWNGFGVVVQAYGRSAMAVLDWLEALAARLERRIMVRLVKGAYWDSEIKRAQELGLADFPVFTRKVHTDVSYLACARRLFAMGERVYPQFATHNAHTCAAVLALAPPEANFEFQRLHGMGEALHRIVQQRHGTRLRIYAPVGAHRDLLAYLVRRLLENGANSSFVNQIADHRIAPERIAEDPFERAMRDRYTPNPRIVAPPALFQPRRENSPGVDLADRVAVATFERERADFQRARWHAASGRGVELDRSESAISIAPDATRVRLVTNPADPADVVGTVTDAGPEQVEAALAAAAQAFTDWNSRTAAARASILREAAALYQSNAPELYAMLAREAGKSIQDAVAELREAIDFLNYYAVEAETEEEGGKEGQSRREGPGGHGVVDRPGAPGGRGVLVCISPWNFPLAIFTGQVAAALAAGNTVIAKPAEQTSLIGARAVDLLHEAGVPRSVLHCVLGDGERVGGMLTVSPKVAGVLFTGSTEVGRLINRSLAAHAAPDVVLVAETGGLNAMIVDSTALPEQAVRDIVASAFQSAGQRCSALRILYLQRDIADRVLEMLFGAMDELVVGDPWQLRTDVGPVIDAEARRAITAWTGRMEARGCLLKRLEVPAEGCFVGPQVIRVDGIDDIEHEVFGPVLHVATFDVTRLDDVIAAINRRGYGLTFGLHTRIDDRVQHVVERIRAGNIYVNRNQIGAVVGSQPFGGEGLSGTGPKAGGPEYLRRLRRLPWPDWAVGHQEPQNRPQNQPQEAPTRPARLATNAAAEAKAVTTALARLGVSTRLAKPRTEADRPEEARFASLRRAFEPLLAKPVVAMIAELQARCGTVLALPGPTGESNRLRTAPRGTALCFGPTARQAWIQALQALGAGGAALVLLTDPAELPVSAVDGVWAHLHWPLEAIVVSASRGNPIWLRDPIDFGLVALGGDATIQRRIRKLLAERDGDIKPLVTEFWAPARYELERLLSIDTTAAGGNASLLAAA